MSSERTEEPTPKRLREARARGEVGKSRELTGALVLLAFGAMLPAFAETGSHAFRSLFELVMRSVRVPTLSPPRLLEAGLALGARVIGPMLIALVLVAAVVTFLQVGPVATGAPVAPKLDRLDPMAGAARLFSTRQLVELLKSSVLLVAVATLVVMTFEGALRGLLGLVERDASGALTATRVILTQLVLRVGVLLAAMGAADFVYQRWRLRQDQKMTKDEVRREHKEGEGDPHTKQERERLHREILTHAMLEQVRKADVLVVNPTHLAIALSYDEERGQAAPEVLAKGQDELAQRMIAAAREAGVPVLRDVPLAHALYTLELADEVPEALYDAVAAVLHAAWAERAEAGDDR